MRKEMYLFFNIKFRCLDFEIENQVPNFEQFGMFRYKDFFYNCTILTFQNKKKNILNDNKLLSLSTTEPFILINNTKMN